MLRCSRPQDQLFPALHTTPVSTCGPPSAHASAGIRLMKVCFPFPEYNCHVTNDCVYICMKAYVSHKPVQTDVNKSDNGDISQVVHAGLGHGPFRGRPMKERDGWRSETVAVGPTECHLIDLRVWSSIGLRRLSGVDVCAFGPLSRRVFDHFWPQWKFKLVNFTGEGFNFTSFFLG